MAFAKCRDPPPSRNSKISGILASFLSQKPPTKTPEKSQKSLEKSFSTHKKAPHNSESKTNLSNNKSNLSNNKSNLSNNKSYQNETEKTCTTNENNDEFVYLDKIKRKIERTLSKNSENSVFVDKLWENEENLTENDEKSILKEKLRKLELKEGGNRQEIVRLKALNEKLVRKIMQLEEIVTSLKTSKNQETRVYSQMEKELSNERRKAGILESKLRKVNPVKTAQLFQEIMIKNEVLIKEKAELEELLKRMLLDKEISKLHPKTNSFSLNDGLFSYNEPQKPYEIRQKTSSFPENYEYLNSNDEEEQGSDQKSLFFAKIADLVVDLINNFEEKVKKDEKIAVFFRDAKGMENLKEFFGKMLKGTLQKEILIIPSDPSSQPFSNTHFEILKTHLISCMTELTSNPSLLSTLNTLIENYRNLVVGEPAKSLDFRIENPEENIEEKPLKTEDFEVNEAEKEAGKVIKTEEESLRFLEELRTHSGQRFEQSVYLKIGGFDKITAIVEKFYQKQCNDSRISSLYEGMEMTRLKHNLKYFLTKMLGGPDIFLGRNMRDADGNFTASNFYAEISFENLRISCKELKISDGNIKQIEEIISKTIEIAFREPSSQSLYELMGGYKAVSSLIDVFYRKLNEHSPLESKEENEKMKQNQKFYITKILGGPDTFLGENERKFWKDPWLFDLGEEAWLKILEKVLFDMKIQKEIIDKVKAIFSREIQ